MPKTKIICTLGPASATPAVLLKMMRAGMDVVRLNFSHGTLDEHRAKLKIVRALNKKYRRHVRLLGDLEGYRIRVGSLAGGKPLAFRRNQILKMVPAPTAEAGEIPFDFKGSLRCIKTGHHIYIDDGNIDLIVEAVRTDHLSVRAVNAGVVKNHKGINIPEVKLDIRGIADHDRPNIAFAVEEGLDFLAQSFVRNAADMKMVKACMKGAGTQPALIAKIENQEGINNIKGILLESDGIMVARGDMGVSLPIYEVPMMQKAIIRACNHAGKFVITATQMLESMTEHRLPTRAEVSDVANAILDGTDYVMLSGETSVGVDPAGCVQMMNQIIKYTEQNRGINGV